MNKLTLLATVAAAALVGSVGVASAQKQEAPAPQVQAPNPAPAAQQKAPAEKTMQHNRATPDKGAQMNQPKRETTGQAQPRGDEPKAKPDDHNRSQVQKKDEHPMNKSADEHKNNTNAQTKPADQKTPAASMPQKSDTHTTGQATRPAGGAVTLNAEQKTRLRTTIVERAPKVAHVDFSINIGTRVPRGRVHLVAVPSTLIEIHPAWRGYEYFVVNDQIIVVNPRTLEIVAVLDV
jgi:hypothetical protein